MSNFVVLCECASQSRGVALGGLHWALERDDILEGK